MQIQESIYGGRADDIYGAPLPVPSIYRNYGVSSAIVLGPLGAWQVPARYTSRPVTFVPSQFWPDAVRAAVVDALAEALVRDVMTPPCESAPGRCRHECAGGSLEFPPLGSCRPARGRHPCP